MGPHQHSEELNDVSERVADLLPEAIEAFCREVRLAVQAHCAATGETIQVVAILNGVAAYKLQYPAGAARFRFGATERLAVMAALFRGSPDQRASAEMQLRATVIVRDGALRFAIDEEHALSAAQLAQCWLTEFFERISPWPGGMPSLLPTIGSHR